jgi:DNA-binding transcriptional MerR regulator
MWTMDELVERVRVALSAEYSGAPNGRVRDVPDRRAIRWYTTTGLVDRPSAMRGRVALYGARQLLQVVAVKRRQAEGLSLAQIQAELTGAGDETLAAVARVPAHLLAGAELPDDMPLDVARPRFWVRAPSLSSHDSPPRANAGISRSATDMPADPPHGQPAARPAPGATTPTPWPYPPRRAVPDTSAPAPATPPGAVSSSTAPVSAYTEAPAVAASPSASPANTAGGARSTAVPPPEPGTASPIDMATDSRPNASARPTDAAAGGGALDTSWLGRSPGWAAQFAHQGAAPAVAVGAVALRGGALLVLPRHPEAADYADIAAAAEPLLDLLAARGLLITDESPADEGSLP